jgi:hypothetical protein
MALWRCMNERCPVRGNHEAADGVCPDCRGSLRVELVPVCYLVPAGSDGPIRTMLGHRMVACRPDMQALPPAATGHRGSVTCPRCLASAIFAEDERDSTDNHHPMLDNIVARSLANGR